MYGWSLLVLLFLTAPGMVQAQGSGNPSAAQRVLAGPDWKLVSLGPAGAETDVVAGTTVTIKFEEDGRVGGSTGCNSYGGTYEVRGEAISFGQLVSTKRACLDQNANEQEHRFVAALEMANRFKLSSNRLTIFSDRGRTVLNFVTEPSSEPDDRPPTGARTDPVATLAGYFSAINARDYRKAYGFWESPPSSFEKFVAGFAGTDKALLMVEPPARTEGAAGSLYVRIPAIIVFTTRGGNERVFAGCYEMRRSNVRDGDWRIYRADVSQLPSSVRISRLVQEVCR